MTPTKKKREEIEVLLHYLDRQTGTQLCKEAAATIRYLMENAPSAAIRNAALEEAALQWDGCMYEGVGEDIDIGAAIRALQSSPAPKQDKPLTESQIYKIADSRECNPDDRGWGGRSLAS